MYISLSGNALNEMSIYGKNLDRSRVPNLKTWNHVLTQEFQRSHRINDVTRSGFRVLGFSVHNCGWSHLECFPWLMREVYDVGPLCTTFVLGNPLARKFLLHVRKKER